jgi:uncharacterized membrane protein YdbT with pleckstrin-like domain
MKCPACNTEVVASAQFCHKCGASLTATAASPGTAPIPATAALKAGRRDVPEEVLWEGGVSPKSMLGTWLLAVIVTIALIGGAVFMFATTIVFGWIPLAVAGAMWLFLAIYWLSIKWGVHYKLTNQRFVHERGIVRRVTDRIETIDIDDVVFEQSLFDRMFGTGKIKISSSDLTTPTYVLEGIDDVKRVAALFDNARRQERLRRGVSIEQI